MYTHCIYIHTNLKVKLMHVVHGTHTHAHLERLYGHIEVLLLEHRLVHLSVLPSSQLLTHLDVRPVQLPLVHVVGDAVYRGLAGVWRRIVESCRESIGVLGVVDDQFREGVKFGIRRYVALALTVKVDSVVKHAAIIAERDGVLPRFTLTLANQETPVNPRTQR